MAYISPSFCTNPDCPCKTPMKICDEFKPEPKDGPQDGSCYECGWEPEDHEAAAQRD